MRSHAQRRPPAPKAASVPGSKARSRGRSAAVCGHCRGQPAHGRCRACCSVHGQAQPAARRTAACSLPQGSQPAVLLSPTCCLGRLCSLPAEHARLCGPPQGVIKRRQPVPGPARIRALLAACCRRGWRPCRCGVHGPTWPGAPRAPRVSQLQVMWRLWSAPVGFRPTTDRDVVEVSMQYLQYQGGGLAFGRRRGRQNLLNCRPCPSLAGPELRRALRCRASRTGMHRL